MPNVQNKRDFFRGKSNLKKISGVTIITNLATRKKNAKSGKESKVKER